MKTYKYTKKMIDITKRWWWHDLTQHGAVQLMKKAGYCNNDSDGYRKLLAASREIINPIK